MKIWCKYCDPKYFVIYGFCNNCKRRCEPLLFDVNEKKSILDWEAMRRKWNTERADLIIDVIRRMENEWLG